MKVKEILTKIGKWLLAVLTGFVLALLAMFQWRKSGEQNFETINEGEIENHAETERKKTKDAILRTNPTTISEQFDGVGEAIDRGTNRFKSGVKGILHRKRGDGTND